MNETVTSAYVHSQLRLNEQELLRRSPSFGGDLTDDTYLDWILTRAKRFFLILVATGVPDQIFGIIDDSYDDDDLPIAEHAVPDLRLSFERDRSLDKRFYRNQFRYLTRIVEEGEHIRHADEETVPIIPLSLKSVVLPLGKGATDKVKLPSNPPRLLLRRRIVLDSHTTENDILAEIANSRRYCHQHIVSVFGSYLHQGIFHILSSPAAEWSLKTFLSDTPKSFSNLPKHERREILINWPHCLAAALAWLHANGEHHGAIRPSNIQVDESFHISLGLLDGDGLLRDMVKSDDVEAYQYGPPERWKRAVTVQSTSSSKVALPSGGRTSRRVGNERWRGPETSARARSVTPTAYTFQATSKGTFARFRLSATLNNDPQQIIPSRVPDGSGASADAVSVTSQGTLRRAPEQQQPPLLGRTSSVMSSESSGTKYLNSLMTNAVFAASPEGRTTVVQTWRSIEHDCFASDIFSLGAVILDILTLLCKRSHGSFTRHRSAKNRNAGRGGGLADASFHANIGQVLTWVQALQNDAQKKAKKDEGKVYHAVGPVLQIALQCLERDPDARLKSDVLERRLADYIEKFAHLDDLHCRPEKRQESISLPIRENGGQPARPEQPRSRQHGSLERASRSPQPIPVAGPRAVRPSTSVATSASSTPGPGTSLNSLLSFNFDGLSDTIVGDDLHSRDSRDHSLRRVDRNHPEIPELPPWAMTAHSAKTKYLNTWHDNESTVDPRLSLSESGDGGAFTYLDYSTSASSESGVDSHSFPYPPSEPPTKAPDRGLPPLPASQVHSPKPWRTMPSQFHPATNDVAVFSQLSKAAPRGRPVRMSSLQNLGDNEEEEGEEEDGYDYHQMLRPTRRHQTPKMTSQRQPGPPQYVRRY